MLLGLTIGAVFFFRGVRSLVERRWSSRLGTAQSRHAYYAEAFALWIFFGIPVGMLETAYKGWLGLSSAIETAFTHPLGLIVLCWPLLRGVPPRAMLADVGLHQGEGILREIGAGFLGYLGKWPLFLLGLVSTALLSHWSTRGSAPGHPVLQELVGASAKDRIAILITVTAFAPLLEEVLFRGLLFRHLRSNELLSRATSGPVGASLISALVFAAVHPQGVLAGPSLLAEGFALAMIRDWRGSLIACVTAHAIHNAVLMILLGG
jgi:membrane protease YdiL (CAAX protease family)